MRSRLRRPHVSIVYTAGSAKTHYSSEKSASQGLQLFLAGEEVKSHGTIRSQNEKAYVNNSIAQRGCKSRDL